MTSSVASSNYVNRAFFDPQEETLSTSNYNVEHRITAIANWERAFFGDYLTKATAVGIANSGQPYWIATVNCCFGDVFVDFGNTTLLQPGTRNEEEGSWWSKVDLRLEQELPGVMADHRTSAFIVIDNFTNLINDEWGVLRRPGFPFTVSPEDEAAGDAEFRVGEASRYEIRLGLRYEF